MRYFVIADNHLLHEGITKFTNDDGAPMRPNPFTGEPFSGAEEHDEFLIEQHNKVVPATGATVYLQGDVVINRKGMHKLGRLNGRKILIRGNHDIFGLDDYAAHFEDIRACVVKNGVIFTHIPVHPNSLLRFKINVHGHYHRNIVTKVGSETKPDLRYKCVSVEQCPNYAPIDMEEIWAYRDRVTQ